MTQKELLLLAIANQIEKPKDPGGKFQVENRDVVVSCKKFDWWKH